MKMKTLLLFIMISIKMIASEPSIMMGYGAGQFKSPGSRLATSTTTYSLGLAQDFVANDKDYLRLTGVFSTNRVDTQTVFSEIDLQVSLRKMVSTRQSVGIGFQVALPLSSSFDSYEITGTGFGVNIGYTFQILDSLSWNVLAKSTHYTLDVSDSELIDRLNNQSISTYITFGVN